MFYVPTNKLKSWMGLLADPENQWLRSYSALELAHAWANTSQFPKQIERVFAASQHSIFHDLELVMMVPEHQVYLDTRRAPSQNDLFVLARNQNGLITIMVEGKVKEPFGPMINEWLKDGGEGKQSRLFFLMKELDLHDVNKLKGIRYQLLHRTASALLEARKYHAKNALMLVHSFSQEGLWLNDYIKLLDLYGLKGDHDTLSGPININGIDLYFCWITDFFVSDIDVIWSRILDHEGEIFTQIKGGEFLYKLQGLNHIVPDRTNVQISKKSIEKALKLSPLQNTMTIQHLRAPSYIYAILTDPRIQLS